MIATLREARRLAKLAWGKRAGVAVGVVGPYRVYATADENGTPPVAFLNHLAVYAPNRRVALAMLCAGLREIVDAKH